MMILEIMSIGNYVKGTHGEDDSAVEGTVSSEEDIVESITLPNANGTGIALILEKQFLLKQALPLLQQLLENKDTLENLMNCCEADDEVMLPRFNILEIYDQMCAHDRINGSDGKGL